MNRSWLGRCQPPCRRHADTARRRPMQTLTARVNETTEKARADPAAGVATPTVTATLPNGHARLSSGPFNWESDLGPGIGGVFLRDTLAPQFGVTLDDVQATPPVAARMPPGCLRSRARTRRSSRSSSASSSAHRIQPIGWMRCSRPCESAARSTCRCSIPTRSLSTSRSEYQPQRGDGLEFGPKNVGPHGALAGPEEVERAAHQTVTPTRRLKPA